MFEFEECGKILAGLRKDLNKVGIISRRWCHGPKWMQHLLTSKQRIVVSLPEDPGGGGCVAEMTDRMGGAVVRDSRCVFGTWVQVNVGKLRDRAVTQLEPCAGVPEVPA